MAPSRLRPNESAAAGSVAPGSASRFAVGTARRVAVLGILACIAGTAEAQYINRALWLGRDDDPLRRDYQQDEEYFVNRWSYVDVPPWWRGESLDPFGNRFFVGGGSVGSKTLTLEAVANAGVDLGSGFTGRFNYLQSENQTTRFDRAAFGLDAALSDSSSLLVQVEGTTDKSRADMSLGAELFRTEHSAHRFMFTLVDAPWRKSERFEYDSAPYGLMFVGYLGDPDTVELVYDLSTQLPFEERDILDGEAFRMNRTIGFVEARVRTGDRDRVVLDLDGELTSKKLHPADTSATAREDADIERGRLRAEWWRTGEGGREYALGASYFELDEDYVRPNAPADSLLVRREEMMLTGRARLPLSSTWSIEPYAIGGHVRIASRNGDGTPTDDDFEGFQGKLGLPLRYSFSDHALLRIDLGLQLDTLKFGGGGVQLLATF